MARKDDILKSFLSHELLESKYHLKTEVLPTTIRDAMNSDIAIVKAIAIIIDGLEKPLTATDNELRNRVLQFLNNAI